MLSAATLNRVSVAYRMGYQAGWNEQPKFYHLSEGELKPFAKFDYEEGYKAGANDRKWSR